MAFPKISVFMLQKSAFFGNSFHIVALPFECSRYNPDYEFFRLKSNKGQQLVTKSNLERMNMSGKDECVFWGVRNHSDDM